MGNGMIFLLGGFALLLFWGAKKIVDINNLVFDIVGVKGVNFASDSVKITAYIRIFNPTDSFFPVQGATIKGEMLLNNFVIGEAETRIEEIISPGSQIVIPVDIVLQKNNYAASVIALITSVTSRGSIFQFVGTVSGSGINYPINLSYAI